MPERSLTALVEALRRLPGIGVKSAQRMAFHLLQHDREGAAHLAAALATALGRAVSLEVEPGAVGDSPARREAIERVRRQREAERIIQDDPLVQELMRQFETARIVPGSVKPH